MTRPNERLLRLARWLEGQVALHVDQAEQVAYDRITDANGHRTATFGALPPVSTPMPQLTGPCVVPTCQHRRPCPNHDGATLTTVENAAHLRYTSINDLTQIDADITTIETMVRDFDRMLRRIMGAPIAEDIDIPAISMCRDNQTGRAGAAEWGDPLCHRPSDTAGLCSAHYQAARKYKLEHGIRDGTTQQATTERFPDGYRARPGREPAA